VEIVDVQVEEGLSPNVPSRSAPSAEPVEDLVPGVDLVGKARMRPKIAPSFASGRRGVVVIEAAGVKAAGERHDLPRRLPGVRGEIRRRQEERGRRKEAATDIPKDAPLHNV
jgi:hypothetical protein